MLWKVHKFGIWWTWIYVKAVFIFSFSILGWVFIPSLLEKTITAFSSDRVRLSFVFVEFLIYASKWNLIWCCNCPLQVSWWSSLALDHGRFLKKAIEKENKPHDFVLINNFEVCSCAFLDHLIINKIKHKHCFHFKFILKSLRDNSNIFLTYNLGLFFNRTIIIPQRDTILELKLSKEAPIP